MKTAQDIVLFGRSVAQTSDTFCAPAERRISGGCQQSMNNFYSDETGQFHAGLWSGGVGAWRVKYTEHEFCTLLEGRVRLTDTAGGSVELAAGDHFVIPAGFEGIWEVLEPARKTYAVFEVDR